MYGMNVSCVSDLSHRPEGTGPETGLVPVFTLLLL